MCRQGASVIQHDVLDTVKDPSIRVFVVWVPILRSDKRAPDDETLRLTSDKRAVHYWDAKGRLPVLFRETLGLESFRPAWDVYLIYPPGITWEDKPPMPVYWQHQLSRVTSAPRLDGKPFAAELRKTLAVRH